MQERKSLKMGKFGDCKEGIRFNELEGIKI